MKRLIRLDDRVYDELEPGNRALGYCVFNVTLLGSIYGLSVLYLAQNVLAGAGMPTLSFNPVFIMMVGVSVTFLIHGAAALAIWVFCRGLGGGGNFMAIYLNMGIAAITMWPMAPALAARQAEVQTVGVTLYTLLAVGYAAISGYKAIYRAAGLTPVKMVIMATATCIYVGCFLYLWAG